MDEGLVRSIGVSNFSAAKLTALLAHARIRPAVCQANSPISIVATVFPIVCTGVAKVSRLLLAVSVDRSAAEVCVNLGHAV